MSTSERNAEIAQRRLAGERPTDLGLEFGITPERVWQIVQAEQRRQRGEAPKKRSRGVPKAAPTSIRPRLRPIDGRMDGRWQCACDLVARVGKTRKEAYDLWLNAAIVEVMPKAPPVPDTPKALASAALGSVPAAVPHTSGSLPSGPEPAITPVHESQVQVVRGAPLLKTLSLASSLGLHADRINAAQPRLQSLHGGCRAPHGGFHDQD